MIMISRFRSAANAYPATTRYQQVYMARPRNCHLILALITAVKLYRLNVTYGSLVNRAKGLHLFKLSSNHMTTQDDGIGTSLSTSSTISDVNLSAFASSPLDASSLIPSTFKVFDILNLVDVSYANHCVNPTALIFHQPSPTVSLHPTRRHLIFHPSLVPMQVVLPPLLSLSKSRSGVLTITHQRANDGAPFKKSDRSEEGCLEHAMSQRASFQVPDTSALKTQTWRKMG